jgi:hypothetical protein
MLTGRVSTTSSNAISGTPKTLSTAAFLCRCGLLLVLAGGLALGPGAQAQTVTGTPAVGTNPRAVAVNPVTNTVYVANSGGGTVTVIDVDSTGGKQTVPIAIATAAPVNDPLTVAPASVTLGTPYITSNPSPSLTATVTSAYTASSAYSGDTAQMPVNPPPTALYY